MRYNLASGIQKMEGYTSVDISPECKPDIVKDLKQFPWDWMEDAEEIRIDNYLEHCSPTDLIRTLNECHKRIKPEGRLWYRVPLLKLTEKNLDGAFTDPTHRSFFTIGTPYYWDKNHPRGRVFGRDYGITLWSKVEAREWKDNDKFLIVEMYK